MKSKSTVVLMAIFALIIMGTTQAYAKNCPARGYSKGSCFSMVDRIPGLVLDETQQKALSAKDVEHKKKMIQLKADHAKAKLDKKQLLENKDFDKNAVAKQIKKVMAIETDMELARLDALDELRKVLTDDQWKMVSAHMDVRGPFGKNHCPAENRHMMKGKGHGMGPGMGHNDAMGRAGGYGMKDCPYLNKTPAGTTAE